MELVRLICRGGWPELIGKSPEDARIVTRSYLDALHSQSIPAMDGNQLIAERVSMSLARNAGQPVTHGTLARDVYALDSEQVPSDAEKREVARHLELLVRTFAVDEVPGWVPASRSPARMRKKLMKDKMQRTKEPSFLAVLTGEGEAAYRRPDGVLVIPIRALGA